MLPRNRYVTFCQFCQFICSQSNNALLSFFRHSKEGRSQLYNRYKVSVPSLMTEPHSTFTKVSTRRPKNVTNAPRATVNIAKHDFIGTIQPVSLTISENDGSIVPQGSTRKMWSNVFHSVETCWKTARANFLLAHHAGECRLRTYCPY